MAVEILTKEDLQAFKTELLEEMRAIISAALFTRFFGEDV